ncbi:MAG: hypothetical protein ACN4G0_16835 [Polyangiales bacterium]
MHRAPVTFAVLVALAAAATFMAPRSAAAYDSSELVASGGNAMVVFIQTLREDETMTYTVFDMNMQCVAAVGGRQAKAVPMPAGRHTIYIAGYNNHRIDMTLMAGRTYFIRLYSTEKFATRVSDVTPVQRGTESYKHVKTWLRGANITHLRDDRCTGKPLDERKNKTVRRLNDANAAWKNGDELFHFKYSLIADDGFTAKEVEWL